jgi:hypothetical protein
MGLKDAEGVISLGVVSVPETHIRRRVVEYVSDEKSRFLILTLDDTGMSIVSTEPRENIVKMLRLTLGELENGE